MRQGTAMRHSQVFDLVLAPTSRFILEPISEIPEQDANASEVEKAQEIFGMALVPSHEAAEVEKPGE